MSVDHSPHIFSPYSHGSQALSRTAYSHTTQIPHGTLNVNTHGQVLQQVWGRSMSTAAAPIAPYYPRGPTYATTHHKRAQYMNVEAALSYVITERWVSIMFESKTPNK
jgi:hypothetical protein